MKQLNYELSEKYKFPEIIEELFANRKVCIFDIETTGLNRNKDQVILIGYMYIQDNKQIIKQIFAECHEEEQTLLEFFHKDIQEFDILITYNGRNFDIPFLQARYNQYNMKTYIHLEDHIDIYQHLKLYKNHLNIENYKLKSIEAFLGIDRQDTISGKESVKFYNDYVFSPNKDVLNKILLHNYEDIYHLGKILDIYGHIPVHKKEFSTIFLEKTYTSKLVVFRYNIIDIAIKDNQLYLRGKTDALNNCLDEVHNHSMFNFKWTPREGFFEILYYVKKHKLSPTKHFHFLELSNVNFSNTTHDYYQEHLIDGNLIISIDSRISVDPVIQLINDTIHYIIP